MSPTITEGNHFRHWNITKGLKYDVGTRNKSHNSSTPYLSKLSSLGRNSRACSRMNGLEICGHAYHTFWNSGIIQLCALEFVGHLLPRTIQGSEVPRAAIRWSDARHLAAQHEWNPKYQGKMRHSEVVMLRRNEGILYSSCNTKTLYCSNLSLWRAFNYLIQHIVQVGPRAE